MLNRGSSTYWQYKADTDFVASWLAKTAKRCGYPNDLLIAPTPRDAGSQTEHAKSKRLKGKARKMANQSSASASSTHPPKPTYKIALGDFVRLAQFIGQYTKRRVRVPENFVVALDRAIKLRKSYSSMYAESGDANGTHNFFIEVLERVRGILSPLILNETSRDKNHGDGSPESVSNMYSNLTVQEPSEDFSRAPDSPSQQSDTSDVNYEAARLEDKTEAMFNLLLLYRDLSEIRFLIEDTWIGYKEGKIDLAAASLMTNTAFELARHMEEDIMPAVNEHGGLHTFLKTLVESVCSLISQNKESMKLSEDKAAMRMYESSDMLSWTAYKCLSGFGHSLLHAQGEAGEPGAILLYKPRDKFDPNSDRSAKLPHEMFEEDLGIFRDLIFELVFYIRGPFMPAEDHLIRGVRDMIQGAEISVSVIFAVQIAIDLHHLMGDRLGQAFHELERFAHYVADTLGSAHDLWVNNRAQSVAGSRGLASINHHIGWLQHDPTPTKMKLPGPTPIIEREPHELLKRHPVFCGILLFKLRMQFQATGIGFVSYSSSILYAAHLYNALVQEELLQKSWTDMDVLLSLHGEGLFVGGRPKPTDNYRNRLMLSLGHSVHMVVANSRKTKDLGFVVTEGPRKGQRSLKELAPVSHMFMTRFCHESALSSFTVQDIDRIVAKLQWKKHEDGSWLRVPATREASHTSKTQSREELPDAVKALAQLRNAIHLESLESSFDYYLMHRVCLGLFRALKQKCGDSLLELYEECYFQDDVWLKTIALDILTALSSAKMTWPYRWKVEGMAPQKLMSLVAEVMEEMIDNGEGNAVDEFLREYIPENFPFPGDEDSEEEEDADYEEVPSEDPEEQQASDETHPDEE
ncbi:hypothetical protein BJX61DRAFT_319974 [Aspergillus egyptiacus]|nr:hypothetical protein BJX61DRAFT_319974 [Aspergillus egyptiacus]